MNEASWGRAATARPQRIKGASLVLVEDLIDLPLNLVTDLPPFSRSDKSDYDDDGDNNGTGVLRRTLPLLGTTETIIQTRARTCAARIEFDMTTFLPALNPRAGNCLRTRITIEPRTCTSLTCTRLTSRPAAALGAGALFNAPRSHTIYEASASRQAMIASARLCTPSLTYAALR